MIGTSSLFILVSSLVVILVCHASILVGLIYGTAIGPSVCEPPVDCFSRVGPVALTWKICPMSTSVNLCVSVCTTDTSTLTPNIASSHVNVIS